METGKRRESTVGKRGTTCKKKFGRKKRKRGRLEEKGRGGGSTVNHARGERKREAKKKGGEALGVRKGSEKS